MLAIASHIPSDQIGTGFFQETHPAQLFAECSHFNELVAEPEQMARLLRIAMQTAVGERGVSVLTIPGDVADRRASGPDSPARRRSCRRLAGSRRWPGCSTPRRR